MTPPSAADRVRWQVMNIGCEAERKEQHAHMRAFGTGTTHERKGLSAAMHRRGFHFNARCLKHNATGSLDKGFDTISRRQRRSAPRSADAPTFPSVSQPVGGLLGRARARAHVVQRPHARPKKKYPRKILMLRPNIIFRQFFNSGHETGILALHVMKANSLESARPRLGLRAGSSPALGGLLRKQEGTIRRSALWRLRQQKKGKEGRKMIDC